MKGSWLRNSHANILTAAVLSVSVLLWPAPADTRVEQSQSGTEWSAAQGEQKSSALYRRVRMPKPFIAPISAPAFQKIAPRLTLPNRLPGNRPEPEARRQPLLPNLFGTVAVATSRTPGNWVQHVSQSANDFHSCLAAGSCGGNAGLWQTTAGTLSNLPLRQRIERANIFVNNRVQYRADRAATGQRDSWLTPAQLFQTGTGDCEDFALAKYWLLREAGVPAEDMYVMVVRDLVARAGHAYLAVRVGDEFVLLDSRTNNVILPENLTDVAPLVSVSATGAFLHGRPV